METEQTIRHDKVKDHQEVLVLDTVQNEALNLQKIKTMTEVEEILGLSDVEVVENNYNYLPC